MRVKLFESSNISSAAWNEATGVVVVTFKGGKTFAYEKFTADAFNEWETSPSAGSWFHRNIRSRPDKFPPIADYVEPRLDSSDDTAAIAVERENVTTLPPPWPDMPNVVSVEVTGRPMTGYCLICGVDLARLAASGETGHACMTGTHTTMDLLRVINELLRVVDGVLYEQPDGKLAWRQLTPPPMVLNMSGVTDAEVKARLEAMERSPSRARMMIDVDTKRSSDEHRPWRSKGRR